MPHPLVTRLNNYKDLQCSHCHQNVGGVFNSVDEVKRTFARHLRDFPACEAVKAEGMFLRGGIVKWR